MKRLFSVLCLLSFLWACATAPAPRQIQNAFPIAHPFEATWQAVIETFAELNLPILNMEKASGLITTDWISFRGQKNETGYCDCGASSFPFREIDRAGRFNVYVKKMDDASCEVRVNAVFEMTSAYERKTMKKTCVSTGTLEARVYQLISEKLK